MSSTPFYPQGNPLTESMPFTDREGRRWLAYIEGIPEPRGQQWWHRATLPGRRLRFDSAAESRVTSERPAGSPFLSDARLQDLLDQAHPIPLSLPTSWQPLESPVHAHPAIEWAARAIKLGSRVLADESRRWREGAGRWQVLGERTHRFLSSSVDAALTLIARIGHSAQARRRLGARLPPR